MKFKTPILIALLWGLVANLVLAQAPEVPVDALEPTRAQRQSTLIILRVIDKYHYKKHFLDDSMSSDILDSYIEALDPNKSFFSARDIDRFEVYRYQLDNLLRQAKLDPAFQIFRVYRQRVDERVEYALKLLQQDYDFTVDESYRFDREESDWAKDGRDLEEIWRKRVKSDILALRLKETPEDEVRTELKDRYSGIRRRVNQLNSDDIFQTFINSYTTSLEPHTSYMSPRISENFDITMRLSLEGIGAVLRSENEHTVVQKTVPGGPARQSGKIQSGDRIIGVGQGEEGEIVDVVGWRLQDVVDKIRGPKGTVVRLRLLPEDEGAHGRSTVVTIVRNEIKLEDQAAKRSVIQGLGEMGSAKIGVIDIPAFYRDFQGSTSGDQDFRSTTRDVRRLIRELEAEGVDGIVIDLRDNGGGALSEAIELTGLFIPSGPVVQVQNSSGELEVNQDPDPEQVYRGPLAVLVDRNSASASEIFAGAIQDYGRGIIIGETTFGKGTVQTLVDLGRFVPRYDASLGRLKLTMAQYFRINGGSTQFQGVIPDIQYPTAINLDEEGERSLGNALPWARIDAARYTAGSLGSFDYLREKHAQRIGKDPGFILLGEQARMREEIRLQKSVDLNETVREKEWESRETRRKEQKNRFLTAIGEEPFRDDEDEEERYADDEEKDPFKRIMLVEAVQILADYINAQTRSAMVQ
jgi:carboxyl-terminal processing protease